ncbi:MAG: hypothetical protein HS116_18485 [Planctomycetes bacterium]|nr:hypothetical protein [Planctomycetota bacterium]
MAAGTRPETKTLDKICALAAAHAGITAARVSQGYKRWPETDNFDKLVRAQTAETEGYFWAALKSVRSNGQGELAILSFYAELVVKVAKDSSSDLNAAWEFALSLRDQLQAEANYGNGEFPARITIGLVSIDAVQGMGIAVFDFGTGEAGGSMEVADP